MCITTSMQIEDCTVIMIFLYMNSVFEMLVIYCKSRFKLIHYLTVFITVTMCK